MKPKKSRTHPAPRSFPEAGYGRLLGGLHALIATARHVSIRAVNSVMTATYWDIGRQIVEFEQGGKSRAAYGTGLMASLSADLTGRHGRGFSVDNLERFRLFYQRFPLPEISATPSRKSPSVGRPSRNSATPLRNSPPAILAWIEQLATRLPLSWSHYTRLIRLKSNAAFAFYHAEARRVLFLVDRANLGRQALAGSGMRQRHRPPNRRFACKASVRARQFQQFVTPDTGRKFTELYNVQHLTSNKLDDVARVTICTIQRLYSLLRGEELDPDLDEKSGYEIATADDRPKDVAYNPAIPIEAFDFIVTDECHRSIYGLWRQVLEYFDAFLVGLTATPSKQTIGFFKQNLVMEYNHERAVADGVNVGYEVYRIRTRVSEQGDTVEKGFYVDRRSKETRATRWERLDEDLTYAAKDLDRSVVVPSQIRTVLEAFKVALFTELFPGRTLVPKTLIFCKDDSHAEDTVHLVREVFGKGNDFAKKITYKTYNAESRRYEKSETLIQEFRTSPSLRIAVTVDMIATGTDIKPLECLLFLRDTRSRTFFEQMKGRGTRVLTPTDLQAVSDQNARAIVAA